MTTRRQPLPPWIAQTGWGSSLRGSAAGGGPGEARALPAGRPPCGIACPSGAQQGASRTKRFVKAAAHRLRLLSPTHPVAMAADLTSGTDGGSGQSSTREPASVLHTRCGGVAKVELISRVLPQRVGVAGGVGSRGGGVEEEHAPLLATRVHQADARVAHLRRPVGQDAAAWAGLGRATCRGPALGRGMQGCRCRCRHWAAGRLARVCRQVADTAAGPRGSPPPGHRSHPAWRCRCPGGARAAGRQRGHTR